MYLSVNQPVLFTCAMGSAALACFTDLRSGSIPNWLTGTAALAGLALQVLGGGWMGGLDALGGLCLCGATFLVFYLAGGMGAGDVKLIAAQGCLLGAQLSLELLLATVIAGGALALVLAVKKRRLGETLRNVASLAAHHRQRGLQPHSELNIDNKTTLRLPYAIAIAAGVAITVMIQPSTRWLQ